MRSAVSARLLVACTTIVLLGGRPPLSVSAADTEAPGACGELAALKLPDVKVTEAVAVPAATTGAVRVPHCRVNGVVGKEIRFSLLLPETWNQKFMMGGGGGFVVGHRQPGARFGQRRLRHGRHRHRPPGRSDQRQLGAQRSRAAVELRPPRGAPQLPKCRRRSSAAITARTNAVVLQRLLERRAAGADGSATLSRRLRRHRRRRARVRLPRDRRAVHQGYAGRVPQPGRLTTAPFSSETLKSVESQLVDKCDAIDGAKDGLIDDPRQCQVDVATFTGHQRCAEGDAEDESTARPGTRTA